MVPHGDVDQVTNSGPTAPLSRRLPSRTCQFHVALQHCGDLVELQENGPMCAVSSSHPVPKLSGIFACTVRSKFHVKLLESNIPTRVATTKYGFISCMSTHGWFIAHLEMGNIGGHSSGKGAVCTTTSRTTWPPTQEIHVAIRERKRDNSRMAPMPGAHQDVRQTSPRERQIFLLPMCGGSVLSLMSLCCSGHPLSSMSHEVQGHRPAFSSTRLLPPLPSSPKKKVRMSRGIKTFLAVTVICVGSCVGFGSGTRFCTRKPGTPPNLSLYSNHVVFALRYFAGGVTDFFERPKKL